MAPVTLDHVLELIPVDATWRVRPGMKLSVTFTDRDQRTRFRTRFLGADVLVAGQAIKLAHERSWCDEHGYGLVLTP